MKLRIKLAKRHPMRAMRLGRHSIIETFREYDLSDEEHKELYSVGGKYWFMTEEKKPDVVPEKKKELKKVSKKVEK